MGIIAPIVTMLSFTGYLTKILSFIMKVFSRKQRYQKEIFANILDWFRYIDSNLGTDNFRESHLGALEREIDHKFSAKYKGKLILTFSKRFRKKILETYGLKNEFYTNENFLRYAKLNYPNVATIIELSSYVSKKKYSVFKLKFEDYWNIIRGNFYNFLGQYNSSWKNLKNGDRKFTIADIETPIKILRYYCNI